MVSRQSDQELRAELCRLAGIELSYTDNAGQIRTISPEAQSRLLRALGFRCDSRRDLVKALYSLRRRPWTDLLEPVMAVTTAELSRGWSIYLPLGRSGLPPGLTVTWEIRPEDGESRHFYLPREHLQVLESKELLEGRYGRLLLPLPLDLSPGYYQVMVQVSAPRYWHQGQGLLIIAPETVFLPEVLRHRRLWGLQLPLYALRSRRNWGIGDWGDLRQLIPWAASLGAGLLGLNPLHHLGSHLEDTISPYYPVSRTFYNPLFLDLAAAARDLECGEIISRWGEAAARLADLRHRRQIDYPAVAREKNLALAQLFAVFQDRHGPPEQPRSALGREFAAFLEQEGDLLWQFGTFLALDAHWSDQGRKYLTWQQWPQAYHLPQGPAVAAFAREKREEITQHCFAQWLARRQLTQTTTYARQQGLPLGLYLDLAVGVNPGGFDTWANQGLFALEVDVGAPPDEFSPKGQNWHLPPLLPSRLRTSRYQYFIRLLRHNCPPEGALRLDHVMGLFRLFWIPKGMEPAAGAYVRYPAAELLKILALESHRQRTLIIGEDLGTVAPYIREELARSRIMSTRLFYFERQTDGSFTPPAAYPEWALAAITTHDLPTLQGFWQGRDIALREQLHLFPDAAAAAKAREERQQAKRAMLQLLVEMGLVPAADLPALLQEPDLPSAVKYGIISLMLQTPCRLFLLSLEDMFSWPEQQNLPGTKDEYPNWRLKLPLEVEELPQEEAPRQVAELARRQRPGPDHGT